MATPGNRAMIVGAGPGGLTAAVALRRVGIDVAVFEQAPELREIGQGLGLQSNAMKALDRLGVAESLLSAGEVIEYQDFYTFSGKLLARMPHGDVARKVRMPTVSVLRSDLQFALLRALDPEVIRVDSKCHGVSQDGDGAAVALSDGRVERASLVIGADGIRSVVREYIVGSTPLRYSGFMSWRGVTPDGGRVTLRHRLCQYMGRGAMFSVFPVGRGRAYWAGVKAVPEGAEEPPTGRKHEALHHFGEFEGPTRALIEETPEEDILRTEIYDRDPVKGWSRGRVALVGDAAHVTTPFMGQGAGLAIEDSVVLAKELALIDGLRDASMIEEAFQAYEAKRTARTSRITLGSRRRGRLFALDAPLQCFLRDTALRLVPDTVWRRSLEQTLGYEV